MVKLAKYNEDWLRIARLAAVCKSRNVYPRVYKVKAHTAEDQVTAGNITWAQRAGNIAADHYAGLGAAINK